MTNLNQISTPKIPLSAFLNPMRDHAKRSGFKYIPTINKRPVLNDWPNKASNDHAQMDQWETDFPGSMLGLPTGAANGIIVIDLDVKPSQDTDGIAEWGEIIHQYGEGLPPDTYTVSTPSGGLHIYFRAPEGIKIPNSVSLLGKGIDVRGDGGQVVSVWAETQDGRIYEPATDTTDILSLPEWLLNLLIDKNQHIKKPPCFLDGRIPEGKRNQNLHRFLATSRSHGMETSDLIEIGIILNPRICTPPLSEAEVLTIAESAGRMARNYSLDNMGNAERLVDKFGASIRCADDKDWYIFKGNKWTYSNNGEINELAKQVATDLQSEAKSIQTSNEELHKKLISFAKSTRNNPLAMVRLAQSDPKITCSRADFDKSPYLLNCMNGVIDLKTGSFSQPAPEMMLSKQCAANYSAETECPRFMKFLTDTFEGDQNVIDFIQRLYGGVGLVGDNPENIMVIFHGLGKNGKSILANTLLKVFGSYSDTIRHEVLMMTQSGNISHDKADIQGARFALASEPPKECKLNPSVIKELTGGDEIKARHIYQNSARFTCTALITLVTNWMPEIGAGDNGLKRRLILVPFSREVPESERDPNIISKLMEEADGILTWLVEGRMEYLKHGLKIPDKVRDATNAFKTDMDWLEYFISEECIHTPSARTQAQDLYGAYLRFSSHKLAKFTYVSEREFFLLLGRNYKKTVIKGLTYYLGLELKK